MADSAADFLGVGGQSSKSSAAGFLGVSGATKVPRGSARTAPAEGTPLPFMDRSILAAMKDSKQDQERYLVKKYGEKAVSQEKGKFVVTLNGKRMIANIGMIESAVAQAPETVLGIAGAAAGSELGLPGGVAGAFAGAAAGRSLKEAVRSATGLQSKKPGEIVKSVERAGEGAAEAEVGTRVLKAPLSRLTRGPIPGFLTDTRKDIPGGLTGKEREALIKDATSKGARLHPQSTMPGARALQRHVIMADRIVGRSVESEQANLQYLKDEVSHVLDKAGVKGSAKSETMGRLEGQTSEMDFQQTGQMIQFKANFLLDKLRMAAKAAGRKPNAKDEAYLSQLAAAGRKPKDVYDAVVRPGETDLMERFFRLAGDKPGKESDVVIAIRQRAIRQILAGALKRTETGEAVGAVDKELSSFTVKQQRMLFPDGLADNLRLLSKKAEMVFPHIEDPGMAGMAAGEILGRSAVKFPRVWKSRLVRQGYEAMWRMFLTNPSMAQRLAIGFKGDSVQRIAARNALRTILYSGFVQQDGTDEGTGPR
jgi:hypothetical protein